MAWIVLAMVVAFPVVEIALFIKSSQAFGVLPTIAAAIAAGMAGLALVRRQGLETALRVRGQLDRGEMPVAAAFDGLCLAVAGALLLLPGFFSDLLALLLLVPPVRALIRLWLSSRLAVAATSAEAARRPPPVIEGEWREIPDDERRG